MRHLARLKNQPLLALSVPVAAATVMAAQGPTGGDIATAVPAYRQADIVALLTVSGPIDRITLRSLERRVALARADGAEAVVLEINTPGGALDATLDICHLIKTDAPGNTVAWIRPQAYSAGTIIALACREIVTAPGASFGDAAPISPFGPIPVTERAKLESPILREVIDSARRNHYDENLVQAFISVGVELWLIEDLSTGERIFVDSNEYKVAFGDEEEPPDLLTPVAPPDHVQRGPRAKPWFEGLIRIDPQSPETAPDAAELKMRIELEQDLPSSRRRLEEADRGRFTLIRQVISNDRLLVVRPAEAIGYGLATRLITDEEQLKAYFGARTLRRYDRSWSESLVRFLTHPVARGMLLVIFVICLLIELAAPGLGAFGLTAMVSLLIFIGAPWLAGMAQWWEIALIIAGLGLFALELFVVPGFGLAGVAGAGCLLVGLVGTFVTADIHSPAGQSELMRGLAATFTALFAAGVACWLLFRQIDTIPVLGRFVLKAQLAPSDDQPAAHTGLLDALRGSQQPLEPGDRGMVETDLRPAGRAIFGGRPVEVTSVTGYIDRGTQVRVVSVGRFVIEVEKA